MKITDNHKALYEAVGLQVKDLGYGQSVIVKKGVGEQVPERIEIADIYYPLLTQRVVDQEVTNAERVYALENGVFLKEEWINGIKEFITNGILTLQDYDKTITIDDFNPPDPTQVVQKWSIDVTKYGALKYSRPEILEGFTNPIWLDAFVNQLITRISDTWRYFMQNEKAKILAGTSDALLAIAWDEIVDTSGMSTLDKVELAVHLTDSMHTASPDWLALTDDTVIYSATDSNINFVMRPYLKAAIARESSSLFNYSQIITDKLRNAPTIDLLKAGIADSGIEMWMLDTQALRIGYQVENLQWDFKAPKLQAILEVHNWFGFAALPNFYKSVWTTNPDDELAKVKKLKGYGKEFKTRITKGIDVLKNIRNQKQAR